jgi:hypothetical protein
MNEQENDSTYSENENFLQTSEFDTKDIFISSFNNHSSISMEKQIDNLTDVVVLDVSESTATVENFNVKNSFKNMVGSAIDSFYLFFTDDIMQFILKQINKGIKKSNKNNTENSNKFVIGEELKIFLGILMFLAKNKSVDYTDL